MPPDYVYKILGDDEYVSRPDPMEMAICEKTFQPEFHLPLHPFIERLLVRYGLVHAQIHPNTWRALINFLIKYVEVRLEPRMRALWSVLTLKSDSSSRTVVYASYRN